MSTAADMEPKSGGGLFGKLLGKKEAAPKPSMGGCDPDLFADEIRTFIEAATARKSEIVDALQQRVAHLEFQSQPAPSRATTSPASPSHASSSQTPSRRRRRPFTTPDPVVPASQPAAASADAVAEEQPSSGSAWASPFEWRPASAQAGNAACRAGCPSPLITNVPLAVLAEDQEEQGRLAEAERQARAEARHTPPRRGN